MRFANFPAPLSKVLRLPRKTDARSYEVLHLSRKIILANLQIWCSKMQPLSGNQRPDLLTSLMNMFLCCACHAKCIFEDPLQMSHACHRFGNATKPSRFAHFWQGAQAFAPATRSTSEHPKVLRTRQFFCTFDIEMWFAPQRRALFRHLNFQKWSESLVFFNTLLGNALRATTACTFSTSQLPKAVRSSGVFCTLCFAPQRRALFSTSQLRKVVRTWSVFSTCECASRHNGVQFFISHLASWLRTRRFSEPTFRPSGPTNHWKNTVFRDFPTFSGTWIFFLLTLSLFDILSSSLLFSSLTLTTSAFSSVHIVGSLTSKLPSVTICVFLQKLVIYMNDALWSTLRPVDFGARP